MKYTKGKRLNVDYADTWQVQQSFVAGLRSSEDFTSDLMNELKIGSNTIRDNRNIIKQKRYQYAQEYKKNDKYIARRKATKQAQAQILGKEQKKTCRHKSEKLKSTVNVEEYEKTSKKKKKTRKCSNCGGEDHTAVICQQPRGEKKKGEKLNGISKDDILDMFT